MKINELLVLSGRGNYPEAVIKEARASGVNHIEAVAFKGETKAKAVKCADVLHWVSVGELGKILNIIKKSGISNIILVGQIAPKNIFSLRLDNLTRSLLNSLPILNSHTIFSSVVHKIEQLGVNVLPAHTFLQKYLPSSGALSKRAPKPEELKDIDLGLSFIKSNSENDVGQTVVIKSGYIVAVEAMEGTNATIKRAGKVGGPDAVVVKAPRLNHDFRYDIPVIGPTTIKVMKKSRAKCLAIEAGSTIILDYEKTIAMANQANITIIAQEPSCE